MNKKKTLKTIGKISAGTLAFVLSLGGAYFLTPTRTRQGNFDSSNDFLKQEEEEQSTHFSKFITKLSNDTGLSEANEEERERHYYGLQASFDGFSISFKKDEESLENNIAIDGYLDFIMRGLHDINFNLDATIDYNSRTLPLEIGFVNRTLYFGLKDMNMKVSSTSIDDLRGNHEDGTDGLIYTLFMASKEEGGLNFDFDKFITEKYNGLIDGLLGGIDPSSMTSSFKMSALEEGEEGIGLVVNEENKEDGYRFNINVQINKLVEDTQEMDHKDINLTVDVDSEYNLERVDLGNIDLGNVKISGALNIQYVKDLLVYAPDDPLYPRYNANRNFVEVINYRGWMQKLAKFLDEENQKFGISFDVDLKNKDGSESEDIGKIAGSINADFSELIDLSDYQREDNLAPLPQGLHRAGLSEKIQDVLNKITFSLEVKMYGRNDEEYGNFAVKYANNEGFLKLNEAEDESHNLRSVMKAKIDTETMNWLFEEMPEMVSNLDIGNADAMSSLFSFITDSELVNGLKNGDYSHILDLIKDFSNDESSINISLGLDTLGLGDNAAVDVVLDSSADENNKILNVELNNIELGSVEVNASISSDGYKDVLINSDEEEYDSLSFLPTVFDQVSGILNSKQAGFAIKGSILDDKNLGIKLDGEGQFDYGEKFGFGNLTIEQYKYENKGLWYTHKIALDVDNKGQDYKDNNAYFVYGEKQGDNIKGKVTIQSVLDIVDVIKTFVNDNKDNDKFTKFIDPIMDLLSLGQFADIINSSDYFRLLKNDVLKSIYREGDTINIVMGGFLLGMEGDINIKVKLENDRLASIDINDLSLSSKKINISLSLKDYVENKESPVDLSGSFMDLSSISLLLKFGINTTANNYYHLTAKIDLSAIKVINLGFTVEVYIVVNGDQVKIYGVINDAKLSSVAQDYVPLYTDSIKSEFTFQTDKSLGNDIGGYFHIKTTTKTWFTTNVKHYKSDSKNFIKSENIITYLLNDFLLVRKSITDLIGDVNTSSNNETAPGNFTNLFTDTGFNYDKNNKRWDIGINLNEITGIDALRELEISIFGNSNEKLSKLQANLNIKASLITVTVAADIVLENVAASVNTWSNSIESAFNNITSVSFSSSYLNNPTKYLTF